MIQTLHIENYRCLRDVTLGLEPLTVLVGANASGKSSVFSALKFDPTADDHWARNRAAEIRVSVRDRSGADARLLYNSGGAVRSEGQWPATQVLQFDLRQLRSHNVLHELRQIGSDGLGLANVFATLTRREQDSIARRFCALVPMFNDVAARPFRDGRHRMVFQDRWRSETWYEPEQVSDGTILMLAFLLLPHQVPAPDVIAIEEPERGLHPFLMRELIRALRQVSQPTDGARAVQVLLATHSADLLESVEPNEVRFLNRSKETGETVVQLAPVRDPVWPTVLREYDNSLGDIWLSGGLGGVPSS
ncbi:MAG: AAA family ATPase [Planctomycetota bacterium]